MQLKSSQINYFAQTTIDPAQAVTTIQNQITPVINWATNWGYQSAFGILGIALFYQVIIMLVKPSK